jgi:hypothetical protein
MAYDSLGRMGKYTVWAQCGTASDVARPLPAAAVPQDASPPSDVRVNPAALVAVGVFLAVLFIIYRRQLSTTDSTERGCG